MTKMICLTDRRLGTIYVNPDHIVCLFPQGQHTGVTTVTGIGGIEVIESMDEIYLRIRSCP
jgi:hypothetical protein